MNTAISYLLLIGLALMPHTVHAWGRHDELTRLALERDQRAQALRSTSESAIGELMLTAEPIEIAAPDLVLRALPLVREWARRYAQEHDTRYEWKEQPDAKVAFGRELSGREQLLWGLDNNIKAPLDFSITASDQEDAPRTPTFGAPGHSSQGSALKTVATFAQEPDAAIDHALDTPAYLGRLRERMDLFYEGNSHTHTFRHYFVPRSLIPPLLSPRGEAPYRAALYAKLAIESLRSGHRYWGYRFLGWAVHYAQDVTQPWHTVLVPSLSFLGLSKAKIRHEVASHHYLTEALTDSWLENKAASSMANAGIARPDAATETALEAIWRRREGNPWVIAELCEQAARLAQAGAAAFAASARPLFDPIERWLDSQLKPSRTEFWLGGLRFEGAQEFDFSGDGRGATSFLSPIWNPQFALAHQRERFLGRLERALGTAALLTQLITSYVLEQSGQAASGLMRK